MSLRIGIVGLPNVGKSTLFQALTQKEVDISNYPFCTIEPNVGVVAVPDERAEKLAALFRSKKTIPAIIEFVDIAGLVRGASAGEGLGNKFLTHIRDTDAIIYVVRNFLHPDIIHVEKTVDPERDIDIVITELLLKDLETIQKRKEKVAKDARAGTNKEALFELSFLNELESAIQNQKTARMHIAERPAHPKERAIIQSLHLLTAKPQIFVINSDREIVPEGLLQKIAGGGGEYVILNVKHELDSRVFSPEERKELGIPESRLDRLIQKSYALLRLITFFTTGEDETRAWTIVNGTRAPQAAGTIHSDFEKKFIRADVIEWEKLLDAGSWARAREGGLVRSEGKDYVVCDGDVMEIKHG